MKRNGRDKPGHDKARVSIEVGHSRRDADAPGAAQKRPHPTGGRSWCGSEPASPCWPSRSARLRHCCAACLSASLT